MPSAVGDSPRRAVVVFTATVTATSGVTATAGPGLIGGLLVGVTFAKALARRAVKRGRS